MVPAFDLDNEVLSWQVEVYDAVARLEKAVLIGKAECSEVGTEQGLGGRRLSPQLSGADLPLAFAQRYSRVLNTAVVIQGIPAFEGTLGLPESRSLALL